MMRRLPYALALVLVLAACSGGTPDATPPPSPVPTGPHVAATLDLGGPEAYGLAVRPDGVWAISYQAGALHRIDPASNTVGPPIRLPNAASVLADRDVLWVAAYGGPGAESRLYRVNPTTTAVIRVETGEVCCDLAVGGALIWAVDPRGAIIGVDEATNTVQRRHRVPVDRNAHTNVVYAGDALWVSSDTTPLRRMDPVSGATRDIDVGGGVPFLAQDGLVWGAAPALLWAVDERTGQIVRRIPLADSIEVLSLAVAADAIWVGIRRPGRVGAVLQLHPTTGDVRAELRDIEIPARIALGFGSVWITDSGSSSVYRITP